MFIINDLLNSLFTPICQAKPQKRLKKDSLLHDNTKMPNLQIRLKKRLKKISNVYRKLFDNHKK